MTAPASKRCSKCREEKPLGEFHRKASASDGLASACKACTLAAIAAYRATSEGKETVRACEATYRASPRGREKDRASKARAVASGRHAARQRRYMAENASRTPEEVAEARARLRPDGVKRCRHCRESLPLGAFGVNATNADGLATSCRPCNVAAVAARKYGAYAPSWDERGLYSCYLCSAPFEHADHKHPKALGGVDSPENLAPACAACNLAKSDTPLEEFRPDLFALVASWPVEVRLVAA